MGQALAIFCALALHASFLLFGGLIFGQGEEARAKTQEVSLLSAEDEKEKPKPEIVSEPKPEEVERDEEPAPDATEVLKSLETDSVSNDAPALDAASLGAIEQALNGSGGGGDFAQELSFASGGRIGGTGKAGEDGGELEKAFNLDEIDQKPNAISTPSPMYPSELRKKKVEGVTTVIFTVDASGRVTNPKIESSDNPAFNKPALDAVKQWKFEPALKGGQRVDCKLRRSIRFQPNS